MAAISVGSVTVDVVPSVRNFARDLRASLTPDASEIGLELGRAIGSGISRGIGDPLSGPLEESRRQQQRRAPRDGDDVAGAFAKGFKKRLEAAFKALPKANIDADSSPADRKIADLRTRMEALSKKTIGVDIDGAAAMAELATIKAELADAGRNATVNVRADTAAASAQLAAVQAEVSRLDGQTARVDVDTSGATASLGGLAAAMAGVAAIPLASTIGAGVAGLAGAFGAAGAGFAGLAAVAVPAVSNIKDALTAEKAAQTASTVAAGQGQARALAMAGAQSQLASAVRNAGFAHTQALEQVRSAQQSLTQSELSAATAERDLTDARKSAQQQLLAMSNSSADAKLSERQATFDLTDAQTAFNKVANDPKSTKDQVARAQLALDQAKQALKERHSAAVQAVADEKAAQKAGVEGSDAVRSARQRLAQADLQVTNSERSLAQARAGVARADRQAADQVAAARRGVTQASLSASSATSKLGAAMAALTPAERGLTRDWKAFTATYKGWAKALAPEVFPVISGGLTLITSQLPRFNGLIHGSAIAMTVLERDAQKALGGPFWTKFIDDVGKEAPVAILGLGHIAGDVFTGLAGVFQAVLPYTNTLLTNVEHLTAGFSTWGQQLGTSSGFGQFFAFVSKEGPVIVADLKSVGGAIFDIVKALAPLGVLQLAVIGPVADGIGAIARNSPGLIQVAVAIYAVNKATKALGLIGLARGFVGVAVAEGTAATGATTLGLRMRALGAYMMGAEAATVSTRVALLGLAKAAAAIGVVVIAAEGVGKLVDSQYGAVASTKDLTASLTELARTGQASGAFASQWRSGALGGKTAMQEFAQAAKEIGNPSFGDYISHGIDTAFAFLPGISSQFDKLKTRMTATDTALASMVTSGNLTGANAAFGQLAAQAAKSGVSVDKLKELFPQYSATVSNASVQNAILTGKITAQNTAMSTNAARFMASEREVIDFNTSLTAASGLLGINGRAWKDNSQAALANRGAILQSASVLQNFSDDMVRNNTVTDANVKKLKDQRNQLIDQAAKFTGSRKAAAAYVDKLVTIPKKVSTSVTVSAAGSFKMKGGIPNLTTNDLLGIGRLPKNAAGGLIGGSGGPRADDKITRISTGEFVVNAAATAAHLPLLAAINDAGNAGTGYRGQGYAGGGLVRPDAAPRLTLPAFAGGGMLSGSYASSFTNKGESAPTITSSTSSVAKGIAAMEAFALSQTVLQSQIALIASALGSGNGGKAVQFARAQLGEPYVWGATGPNSWDCSGLTHGAWKAAGKEIGRTTYQQINAGRAGSRAQALPGDLHLPETGHVMMFNQRGGTGGSQEMIHAPHTGDHVRYAPFRGGGWVRLIASPGGGSGGGSAQSASAAKSYARGQLGEFGWSGSQFSPLEALWNRESNWRWNAKNKSSGAYGIPQSLPASKMRSAGSDYLTNALTQVRWGLGYIDDRYGNPSKAYRHESQVGWYDNGGYLPPGLSTVYNGTGGPEPVLTSQQWDAMATGSTGGPEYHAHFDGLTGQSIEGHVRSAFHSMEVSNSATQRVGRRR